MKKTMTVGCLIATACSAADYTWLASPVSANWLTDLNWDAGAWDETSTANKAVFGASSQTSVDVNTDGTEWTSSKQWCLLLADGGKTLQFGALRGTQVIVR